MQPLDPSVLNSIAHPATANIPVTAGDPQAWQQWRDARAQKKAMKRYLKEQKKLEQARRQAEKSANGGGKR